MRRWCEVQCDRPFTQNAWSSLNNHNAPPQVPLLPTSTLVICTNESADCPRTRSVQVAPFAANDHERIVHENADFNALFGFTIFNTVGELTSAEALLTRIQQYVQEHFPETDFLCISTALIFAAALFFFRIRYRFSRFRFLFFLRMEQTHDQCCGDRRSAQNTTQWWPSRRDVSPNKF